MQNLLHKLEEQGLKRILLNEPLSSHTTWKIGGPARVMVLPESIEELQNLMRTLAEDNVPYTYLGRGSNLLVSDEGFEGVVIKLGKGFDYRLLEEQQVTVGCGHSTIALATIVSRAGYTGLEFAGGIPGSLGGAVYMNAGAHGSNMAHVFLTAKMVTAAGRVESLSKEMLEFAYRYSKLQDDITGLLVEVTLAIKPGDLKEITEKLHDYKAYRRKTQPIAEASAGSLFRNPSGDHAARLIEEAGLKGYSVGDMAVSHIHANFIVNRGLGTAKQLDSLIEHIKEVVYRKSGTMLVPEVRRLTAVNR
ncbi:MAG: UDP-N-acetylenolpyruvoylglucosamine reductase [Bacillota bacterium]|jgi:UDP-N-acetylmuramate dehydrogenase